MLSFILVLFFFQERVLDIRVSEGTLRKVATEHPKPNYPLKSIRKKSQGLVVVTLLTDINGNVTDTKVIQAPDSYIADATVQAIKKWKFKDAQLRGVPVNLKGKISFYFSIKSKKGIVEDP